jgi:hypothetical protein
MYGETTVLFHDDNGPPPVIDGGGLLSGTWGDYCRENPDSGPPSTWTKFWGGTTAVILTTVVPPR